MLNDLRQNAGTCKGILHGAGRYNRGRKSRHFLFLIIPGQLLILKTHIECIVTNVALSKIPLAGDRIHVVTTSSSVSFLSYLLLPLFL